MISVSVSGIEEAEARLRAASEDAERGTRKAVYDASIETSRKLKGRFLPRQGYHQLWGPMSASGSFLTARSGQSKARITQGGDVIERRAGAAVEYRAEVGSPDPHIAFLEEGGTIRGSQFLRIPTVYAQTPSGQDRNTGQSAKNIPGTFLIRSKAGRLWIMQKRGPSRTEKARTGTLGFRAAVPLYLLVRSVTQRGRHLFRDTAAEMAPKLDQRLSAEVTRLTERANG